MVDLFIMHALIADGNKFRNYYYYASRHTDVNNWYTHKNGRIMHVSLHHRIHSVWSSHERRCTPVN